MVNIPLVDVNLDIHGTTAFAPQAPPALLPAEIQQLHAQMKQMDLAVIIIIVATKEYMASKPTT